MRPSDDRGQRHLGQRTNNRLDLGGIDPLAARLDQVLGAAGDDQVADGIDARQVAGRKPAVGIRRRLLIAEIALDDRGAAHAQVSLDAALFRQRAPVGVGEQQVDADGGPPRQVRRAQSASSRGDTVPDGDSSVMPQLVCTVTPKALLDALPSAPVATARHRR